MFSGEGTGGKISPVVQCMRHLEPLCEKVPIRKHTLQPLILLRFANHSAESHGPNVHQNIALFVCSISER